MFYTPIHVRYNDIDVFGHVNNAVFISYVEEGRIGYFQKVVGKKHDWSKFGTLLAHTSIDYHHPIYMEDNVECGVSITSFGEKSIDVAFEIRVIKEDQKVIKCASGKNVLVCFDNVAFRTALVPNEWKEKVTKFEKNLAHF